MSDKTILTIFFDAPHKTAVSVLQAENGGFYVKTGCSDSQAVTKRAQKKPV